MIAVIHDLACMVRLTVAAVLLVRLAKRVIRFMDDELFREKLRDARPDKGGVM